MRRTSFTAASVALAVALSSGPAEAAPRWKKKLRKLTRSSSVSMLATRGNEVLVDKRSGWRRIPASNQKLLLSMALLDKIGPAARFRTTAFVEAKRPPFADAGEPNIDRGTLRSNLWVTGRGDPTLSGGRSAYGRSLSIEPTWVGQLARSIKKAGVRRIAGHVVGVKSYFRHDWSAPGWKPSFPRRYIALPSALSINGNVREGRHVEDPEWHLARALTKKLRAIGVKVWRRARSGTRPGGVTPLASTRSRPLRALIGHMNRTSSNFFAEVLGKALAVDAGHRPGTIAGGAGALGKWMRRRNVHSAEAHDGSGLSYSNRASAKAIVKLLRLSERASWGDELFRSLPKGGWGTLRDRLRDVRLRAKTGTLERVSSLSGWVWLRRSERWARFSILIGGPRSWEAKATEDKLVRILARHF